MGCTQYLLSPSNSPPPSRSTSFEIGGPVPAPGEKNAASAEDLEAEVLKAMEAVEVTVPWPEVHRCWLARLPRGAPS